MTLTDETAVLAVDGLTVDIPTPTGTVRVLRGVDFDVRPGEIIGIVGESGSGKSMTALSIMQLLPAGGRIASGDVRFDGQSIARLPAKLMRSIRGKRIGMVFQDPMTTLDPVIKVGDQIDEAYRIHHRAAKKTEVRLKTIEMLAQVGVPDPANRAEQYPHQWSGGMRQRAVIAMALVNDPDVVIADEPTTALDATVQAQVLDVLVKARDTLGVSVILITHDLGIIAQVATRVVVMYAGSAIEIAPTEELFVDSRHPYSQALIDSRPANSRRGEPLPTIPGRPPAMAALPPGCPFAPRCNFVGKSARCDVETPALEASADGRLSACHFRDVPKRMAVA